MQRTYKMKAVKAEQSSSVVTPPLTAPCFVYILVQLHALNSTLPPIGCPVL